MKRNMAHTSVPHWALASTADERELPAAWKPASCTVLDYGAPETAARWSEKLDELRIPHDIVPLPPLSAAGQKPEPHELANERAVIERCLASATVGWRLIIVGALPDVLRARSLAEQGGLLVEEILAATTRTDLLPVTCVHCDAITIAQTGIDGVVPCGDCAEPLLVYAHVSRRKGSFLGFKVDAEEWEPSGAAA